MTLCRSGRRWCGRGTTEVRIGVVAVDGYVDSEAGHGEGVPDAIAGVRVDDPEELAVERGDVPNRALDDDKLLSCAASSSSRTGRSSS